MDDEFVLFTPGPKPSQKPGDVETVTYRRQLTSVHNEVLGLGDKRIPFQFSRSVVLQQMVPNWDSKNGLLTWKGKKIGKFRLRKIRTVPDIMLSAFQDSDWPVELENPLGLERITSHEIHKNVNYLNSKLVKRTIKFHVRRSGKAIFWQSIESTSAVETYSE